MLRPNCPFLDPGPVTRADTLAIIQLSKDDLLPVYLRESQGEHDGYAEGHVINTRFGSFPHSTLIGIPWGSQVRASVVDTGSRGRKRKRDTEDQGDKRAKDAPDEPATVMEAEEAGDSSKDPQTKSNKTKQAATAKTGFIHLLRPTPELWTSSLPHRTQVVYTPDYSYILQRIRARPGSVLIEAGAGSGSFTHAAMRAVYNGYNWHDYQHNGKVFSFEFHEQRFKKMQTEIRDHALDRVVKITHRDVYADGFSVDGQSPEADAVFLDLPAPWLALPHLSRRKPKVAQPNEPKPAGDKEPEQWVSPLNPHKSVYICTFSPCIEQVTQTVSELRRLGWVDIEMVEINNKRIQVFREKIGLNFQQDRAMQQSPHDVAEAVAKLKDIEVRFQEHQKKLWATGEEDADVNMTVDGQGETGKTDPSAPTPENGTPKESKVKPWMEGKLITRTEPEIKEHTSYLVFAVLPREWTEEDEAAAFTKWPCGKESKVIGNVSKEARKQEKRERMQSKKKSEGKRKQDAEKEQEQEQTEGSELPGIIPDTTSTS
ncbi:putative trna (adenine-n -)-methyltransferase catalytic subunit trm61 protein [Phaeoacremonium minimum UCRPA7]|uniref:tRNA (adenine(58)-N(1))-methyltransferase catalytic subunit TRM61 n=1 Tax=Phaeoacremonium minimum (strain UCR-PA7) TaxID=1286976 RepID=R8BH64_PHAM7|nr:putative trna (adenine-n -)-methyltransferase catalytic subunit trm61 protein [Phaeoacremonium minimum UCRPA7]EON98624.1 putative trna (adenine-n -)-methyltransferase catalytic subunit trm61 protein [Phaeoacremonium minimum UCRPA7]